MSVCLSARLIQCCNQINTPTCSSIFRTLGKLTGKSSCSDNSPFALEGQKGCGSNTKHRTWHTTDGESAREAASKAWIPRLQPNTGTAYLGIQQQYNSTAPSRITASSGIGSVLAYFRRAGASQTTEIFSPTNTACTIYSNVTYFVLHRPPWTMEEGDMASFFVQDLELALVAKTCPHRSQALKRSIMVSIAVGKQFFFLSFLERADCSYCKARLQNVSRNKIWYSKIWLRRTSFKSCLSPKAGPILKLSN